MTTINKRAHFHRFEAYARTPSVPIHAIAWVLCCFCCVLGMGAMAHAKGPPPARRGNIQAPSSRPVSTRQSPAGARASTHRAVGISFRDCRPLLQQWKPLLKIDRQGETLYQRKLYPQAVKHYQRAYAWLKRHASKGKTRKERRCAALYVRAYVSRLAITYHWMKAFVQARRLYARCVVQSPKKRQREACLLQRKRVETQLVRLQIRVVPKDARASLRRDKDKPVPFQAPMEGWYAPGLFVLHMSKAGYASLRGEFVLSRGTRVKQKYVLRRSPCPPVLEIGGEGQITIIGAAQHSISTSILPLQAEQTALHQDPLELRPGLTPGQIALVVGGATVGAALVGLGVYGIYRLNTHIYNWSPNTP